MPDDQYEILPHKEIEELRKELESLREMDVTPTKKLHISIIELNRNIQKLLDIFEEALHEIKVEEGGLLFADKIRPMVSRMDRLEKNMENMADVLSNVIAPTLSDLHEGMATSAAVAPSTGDLPPPSSDLPPAPGGFSIPPPPGR